MFNTEQNHPLLGGGADVASRHVGSPGAEPDEPPTSTRVKQVTRVSAFHWLLQLLPLGPDQVCRRCQYNHSLVTPCTPALEQGTEAPLTWMMVIHQWDWSDIVLLVPV